MFILEMVYIYSVTLKIVLIVEWTRKLAEGHLNSIGYFLGKVTEQ